MSLKNRRVQLILLVLLVLINSSPFLLTVPSIDSGVFLYTARQMLRGDVPYRDIWDHKAPGIYFINVLALILSPHSRWGLWILEVISLSAAALLSFESFKRAFDDTSAFWGTAVWVTGFILVYEKGNFTEEFALPFKFATLYIFVQLLSSKSYVQYGYLMGLAAGLTFFLRQNLIGINMTCIGYLLLVFLKNYQWENLFKFFLSSLSGFATITLIFVAYFSLNSALDDFWDVAFRFNFVYIDTAPLHGRRIYLIYGLLILAGSGLVPAAFLGWIAAVVALYKKQLPQQHAFLWIGILTLPLEFFLSSLSGKVYPHYYMTWLPILALLTSFLIYYVPHLVMSIPNLKHKDRLLRHGRLLQLIPILTLVIGSVSLIPTVYEDKAEKLAAAVVSNTHRGDKVFVWGHNPTINFLADRESPTRFIYQTPLFTTDYGTEKIFAELHRDITANPPTLIVEDEFSEIPPLNSVGVEVWKGREIPPSAQAFFEFVAENYVQTENEAIYRYSGK